MSEWHTPLRLASLHDKARKRAQELRREADELDAKADVYHEHFEQHMREPEPELQEATVTVTHYEFTE